jgi:hypothetical protein
MRFFSVMDSYSINRPRLPLVHLGGDNQIKVYLSTHERFFLLRGIPESEATWPRIKNIIQHRVWVDYVAEKRKEREK